jgi:RimJ/RimL family protein N-acetyltransferase
VGRRVRLAEVGEIEEQWLYETGTLEEVANRWLHPPGTTGRQQFHDRLWNGVLAQFVLRHVETSDLLGQVVAYQASTLHGTASLAVMLAPGAQRLGWPLEGALLFIDYVFRAFGLRKLYAEVTDYNLTQYRSIVGRFASEEGCLRQHLRVGGSYHDVHILAIARGDWDDYKRTTLGWH